MDNCIYFLGLSFLAALIYWVVSTYGLQRSATEIQKYLTKRLARELLMSGIIFVSFRNVQNSTSFVSAAAFLFYQKAIHWHIEDYNESLFVLRYGVIDRFRLGLYFVSDLMNAFNWVVVDKLDQLALVLLLEHSMLAVLMLKLIHRHTLVHSPTQEWEDRIVGVQLAVVVTDCLRVILYLVFTVLSYELYGNLKASMVPLCFTIYELLESYKNFRSLQKNLGSIPKVDRHELEEEVRHCTICLEQITPGSRARKLACNHIFHSRCLFTWFEVSISCPNCRQDVPILARAIVHQEGTEHLRAA